MIRKKSSIGNEGKIVNNKKKAKKVRGVETTDNTGNTNNTNNTDNKKSLLPVLSGITYLARAFPESQLGNVKRHFYETNNKPITFESLCEKIGANPKSLRTKISQNKGLFEEKVEGNKSLSVTLITAEFDRICDHIEQIKQAEETKEANLQRKQWLENKGENIILELKKFCELYKKQIIRIKAFEGDIFIIDFNDLIEFDENIGEELLNKPERIIPLIEIAFSDNFIVDENTTRIRIKNLPKDQTYNIENLRSRHINELICLEGRVVSSSGVKPQMVSAKFECPSCGTIISVLQIDKKFREPSRCSCGRRGGFKIINKEMVDTAKIILEDLQEKTENPHTSRLNCFLKEDLVTDEGMKTITPGNEVKLVGILKEIPISLRTGGMSVRFELAIEVNFVELCESEVDIKKFTREETKEIKQISKLIDQNGLKELNKSFAPHVFGYEEIKNALILQLCDKRNKTGKKIRTKQNILLIGDPGIAKSELGKFSIKLTPGSRIATGGGSSAVGITASVTREEGEGWRVEPGAMVIAKELLFLDELNNLSDDDKPKLQEGMSEQRITIHKANIHMSMKVTAGMLASANPVRGFFTTNETLPKQFNLPPAIINRFDLIFPIKDIVNEEIDKSIAKKMIDRDLGKIKSKYSKEQLEKFLVYIRSLEDPMISEKISLRLQNIYSELRKYKKEDVNINPRIHEAILRILKASAKIRMSKMIEEKDIERAIGILNKSHYNTPSYINFKPIEIKKEKKFGLKDQTIKDLEKARNPNFTEKEVSKAKQILDKNKEVKKK